MLDERKTAILRAVVQEYIATAQPVGSTHIAGAQGVTVSSATVRHEMAVLEQEGFLAQPHTSAGRIPTDKGYRFFVDTLTPSGPLDKVAVAQVSDFFGHAHGRLEELLASTSNLVASLTSYASVVVGPPADVARIRSVQVVGLSLRMATVVTVMSNGSVHSETIEMADEIDDARLGAVGAHLQAHLLGLTIGEAAEPDRVPGTGDAAVDSIIDQARQALRPEDGDPLYVGGASAISKAFDAVEVVRQVLATLEQQYVVVGLVRSILDRGLSVAIGTEHGVEPLAACSVVVAPVLADGERIGTVGVLGPTRMNYPQALATVEIVSDRLGRRLGDG